MRILHDRDYGVEILIYYSLLFLLLLFLLFLLSFFLGTVRAFGDSMPFVTAFRTFVLHLVVSLGLVVATL